MPLGRASHWLRGLARPAAITGMFGLPPGGKPDVMVRKKMEGNEQQRRAAAHRARREGDSPSARKQTLGASKQRAHQPRHEPHEEKMAALHQGKQRQGRRGVQGG